jgi:hypothetical protein
MHPHFLDFVWLLLVLLIRHVSRFTWSPEETSTCLGPIQPRSVNIGHADWREVWKRLIWRLCLFPLRVVSDNFSCGYDWTKLIDTLHVNLYASLQVFWEPLVCSSLMFVGARNVLYRPFQWIAVVLASTVVLGIGPRRDAWPYFCPFEAFACFEMGPPLCREEGSDYYWSLPFYWGVNLLALTHSFTHSLSLQPQVITSYNPCISPVN